MTDKSKEVETESVSLRALTYLRVSSTQQADKDYDAEGFSIPGQREACQREAEKLGAEVVEEYIDRGESAKTAKRPALKAMLERLKRGGIDYVIVHKVDRLARNRADDVEIVMVIRQAGAQLVSVTENIDETPSGLLLHGIMSSIAEFYSRNLAAEVMKGTTQKAKNGGTPYRAPIGYLNSRTMVDGREVRTITLDPDRAPHVREAFELYAKGDYSILELAAILEERGLRSRPTRKVPAQALGANRLSAMLRNPYYLGMVTYAGKVYPGRHEPLVDEATFQGVQDLLTSKRVSGERPWRHFHYLRGSLFCQKCDGRLMYDRIKGAGGEYEYFVCAGRKQGTCPESYHRVAAVEAAVERHYATRQLSKDERQRVQTAIRKHVEAITILAAEKVAQAEMDLTRLDQEERKLLTAHYADQVSETLFADEQARISRERVGATKRIEQLSFKHEQVLVGVDLALALTDDIQRAYCLAGPQERRLFNQAFFEWLKIEDEEVVEQQLAEPFKQLSAVASETQDSALAGWDWREKEPADAPKLALAAEIPGSFSETGDSHVLSLVPLRGFEPRFPD
jgi:site-specific DNA recombinase